MFIQLVWNVQQAMSLPGQDVNKYAFLQNFMNRVQTCVSNAIRYVRCVLEINSLIVSTVNLQEYIRMVFVFPQ